MEIYSSGYERNSGYNYTPIATVYIGIGSNIDSTNNMEKCATLLIEEWPEIAFSSVYKSAPLEVEEQEEFLNAVAKLESNESPQDILLRLRSIEKTLKKSPPFRFGPRTIDLDVLLYDDLILEEETLTIPHPRMHERKFVIAPLCELIDTQLQHPTLNQTWEEIEHETHDQECRKTKMAL